MITRTLVALAVAGFTGLSTVAALAQERPLGHESAVGPRGMGPGREAPGPARPERPPPAPMAAPRVHPGPAVGPAPVPQGPAMGPRPMVQAPQRPMEQAPQRPIEPAQQQPRPVPRVPEEPNHGPAGAPRYSHHPAPNTAPQVAPAAPINRAPRAVGAVPAPFHGNMRHFVDQDARVWQRGRWHHDRHGGRDGWWWVVGGLWYFYPQPVYPYPDPYIPGDVIYTYGPSAPGSYWYYCASAGQYYPYVTYCPEGWQPVIPSESDDFQGSDD